MARQVCEDKSSSGFCYSDASSGNPTMLVNQIQGFVSDPEMFNLTTGMEMIGFPKSDTNAAMWRSFISKHAPSSSKTINDSSTTFYHHDYNNNKPSDFTSETSAENLIVPWQDEGDHNNNRLLVDDSSLRCVFPCEANERPSQGLSLSLSSTNPSSIGLQSFELRQTSHHPDFVSREGTFPAYLVPAQDLLNEFCSLGVKQSDVGKVKSSKKQWEEENNNHNNNNGIGSSKKASLTSLEFVELQKRKTKLLAMLEEVDRRYKHYRNQMRSVVSSFEAVAGNGAATVYSALALKAMSRHFRCLKDGILGQIQALRKAMGEKDPIAPGTTRGETPRLKVIDQTLRQQRAFQQMSMMETHPWRPQRGLPERAVSVLRAWLFEHFLHPYPSDVDKHILARQTGLSRGQAHIRYEMVIICILVSIICLKQVSNWFINARVRLWKPMVEEMYLEEVKDHENNIASSEGEDQKPSLIRIDSECASSIVNNHTPDNKNDPKECFGSVELDFSSYTHHSSGMVSYDQNGTNNNNNVNKSGVSLTLGLQQHGVSLAFPPATQSSLYYPRDQIEDCQPVQYSLLDAEPQNLPYRNLMGAQLLHDLAG
uniref:Homeobox protein BEL1 isogeny n=1 Tax=Cajanus cajan TaxID=3821 RepID=A0A151TJS0_CAJCA|nr:Homeobox protein BEL1 isogeny [Cajanus cajan]